MTSEDSSRIERRMDELTAAVTQMLVIAERQKNDKRRLDAFEEQLEAVGEKANETDRKLDRWIDRGIGAWGLAALIFAGLKYLH